MKCGQMTCENDATVAFFWPWANQWLPACPECQQKAERIAAALQSGPLTVLPLQVARMAAVVLLGYQFSEVFGGVECRRLIRSFWSVI